ncbi:MAG: CDC27 family protein, partial [Saprospiraceae bacterium]
MISTNWLVGKMKSRLFFCILNVSLFIFQGTAQKDYSTFYDGDSILREGIKYYDLGQYDKALAEYDKIFKTDPMYFTAKYERMLSLSALGLTDQLHDELEDWYNSEHIFEVPEAVILYANSLTNKKKFDEAQKVFDRCLKVIPESSVLMYNIALMHYNQEDKANCVEYLKKTITLNPNHGTAHYFLGLVCLEEGKIVPGALAMLGYLVLDPKGEYAEDAVKHLNVKMAQSYLKSDSKVLFPAGGDDFAELESILRDQLPLNPKYKLNCEVDEIFTRHAQAIFEYADSHLIRNGFFEKTYLPWMKQVQSKKMTESALYYLIQIFGDQLKKTLSSKQKEIDLFADTFINKDFWSLFSARRQMHYGKEQDVVIFIKQSHPYLSGPIINGKYEGAFRMMDKHGRTTGDLFFKDDMLEGKQVYYQKNGKLSETTEYTKGKKHGVRTTYFENGRLSGIETYKDDVYDGPFQTFYPNGNKNCEGTYVKDQLVGSYNCFNIDGGKRLESNLVNDKLNGSYKMYNPGGDLISSFEYINGELTGTGLE